MTTKAPHPLYGLSLAINVKEAIPILATANSEITVALISGWLSINHDCADNLALRKRIRNAVTQLAQSGQIKTETRFNECRFPYLIIVP